MKIEIVIRDEQRVNERFIKAPISMEALQALTVEEQKNALHDAFLRAYYEMTGQTFNMHDTWIRSMRYNNIPELDWKLFYYWYCNAYPQGNKMIFSAYQEWKGKTE